MPRLLVKREKKEPANLLRPKVNIKKIVRMNGGIGARAPEGQQDAS